MKKTQFIITSEDITTLQKTTDQLLTDNDQPLDLFCRAFDLRTENDYQENNRERKGENERHFIKNKLDFEKSYLKKLTKEGREYFADHLDEYDQKLKIFIEKAKEYYMQNQEREDEETQTEFEKAMDELYEEEHKQYIKGDYSEPGICYHIQRALDKVWDNITFQYDDNTGNITIEIEQEDDEETETDYNFLQTLKYKAIDQLTKTKAEIQKRKEENNIKKQRAEEHKKRQEEQKKQKLLSFNQ
jgi:hypothetical protein